MIMTKGFRGWAVPRIAKGELAGHASAVAAKVAILRPVQAGNGVTAYIGFANAGDALGHPTAQVKSNG